MDFPRAAWQKSGCCPGLEGGSYLCKSFYRKILQLFIPGVRRSGARAVTRRPPRCSLYLAIGCPFYSTENVEEPSKTLSTTGVQERVIFADGTGLRVMTGGATYASVGLNELHVEAPVTVMDASDPGQRISIGVLRDDFNSDEKGYVTGTFTLSVLSADN